MTLPILPPAPSRTDPANFSATADAWVAALPAWTNAVNAIEGSLQASTLIGTSTTSLSVGTGAKGFATQPGKAWLVGSYLFIVAGADPNKVMQGKITAYNSSTGSLVVDVSLAAGSGTYDNWSIGLTNPSTTYNDLSVNSLGIGTSSPVGRLDAIGGVQYAGNFYLVSQFRNTTVSDLEKGVLLGYNSVDTSSIIAPGYQGGIGALAFWTHNGTAWAERKRLDSSGNLGLGVIPSAWGANGKAFETSGGSFYGFTTVSVNITNNAYFDGTNWIYKNPGPASNFRAVGGGFDWNIAPSGTAGSPITFTQGMTLTSSNNLLLGTTSELGRLTLQGTVATIATVTNISQLSGGIRYIGNAQPNQTESGLTFQAGGAGGGAAITLRRGYSYETALDFYVNNNHAAVGACQRAMVLSSTGSLLIGQYSDGGVSGINGDGTQLSPGTCVLSHISGSVNGSAYASFGYAGVGIGSITQNGTTGVLYNTASDLRLKKNILDSESSSEIIDNLHVRQYDWKSDDSHQRYGFIAQELVEVFPEAVNQPEDPEAMMAVDYSKLVPVLVKEIQSLRKRLAAAGI